MHHNYPLLPCLSFFPCHTFYLSSYISPLPPFCTLSLTLLPPPPLLPFNPILSSTPLDPLYCQIVIKNLKNEVTKKVDAPSCEAIFHAGTGHLLLREAEMVTLFDIQQKKWDIHLTGVKLSSLTVVVTCCAHVQAWMSVIAFYASETVSGASCVSTDFFCLPVCFVCLPSIVSDM